MKPNAQALAKATDVAGEMMADTSHDAIVDHERRLHADADEKSKLPPRRTRPITAVPFPEWVLPDDQVARAIEMMTKDNASLEQAALILDVPSIVLERSIADYRPPYKEWIWRRAHS